MTANKAGKLAATGVWMTLRRLRDHWVLLVFMATALFWARDLYDEFIDLPQQVVELRDTADALRSDIAQLQSAGVPVVVDRSPALIFPGLNHAVEDGSPGHGTTVHFRPTERVRDECQSGSLAAYMIDASGQWYSVETDLVRLPQLAGPQDLAFGVQIHPRMTVGRAQFLVQVVQNCGSHLQVDSSPRLHFRVLEPEAL